MIPVLISAVVALGAQGATRMPEYGKGTPPEPRPRKDVEAVLAGAPDPSPKTRDLHVVLVDGKKDHGPGEHDYPAWKTAWSRLLGSAKKTKVSGARDWPNGEQLKSADVLVFYQRGTWNAERARDLDAFLKRGGGLAYLHYAVDGGKESDAFAERIGLTWKAGQSKFRHGPLDLTFTPDHPVTRNLKSVHFHDESYWRLGGDPKRVRILATGIEEEKPQPLMWVREASGGRIFVSILGHYSWTFDDPLFRVLVLRGVAWAAREPVDRFNPQVTQDLPLK